MRAQQPLSITKKGGRERERERESECKITRERERERGNGKERERGKGKRQRERNKNNNDNNNKSSPVFKIEARSGSCFRKMLIMQFSSRYCVTIVFSTCSGPRKNVTFVVSSTQIWNTCELHVDTTPDAFTQATWPPKRGSVHPLSETSHSKAGLPQILLELALPLLLTAPGEAARSDNKAPQDSMQETAVHSCIGRAPGFRIADVFSPSMKNYVRQSTTFMVAHIDSECFRTRTDPQNIV